MLRFAFQNLLAKKARTALALTGLTISIFGVIGLISVSGGIHMLLRDALSLVEGIQVLRKETRSPMISRLPADCVDAREKLPGVRVAVPTVFWPATLIDGRMPLVDADVFEMYVVVGTDVKRRDRLRGGGVFKQHLIRGRPLEDPEKPELMIPEDAARHYKKDVGDRMNVNGQDFEIVGVFRTRSLLLDRDLVVPLKFAQKAANMPPSIVSTIYVESEDGTNPKDVAREIERALPDAKAMTPDEVDTEFSRIWAAVDVYLAAIASIAVAVGAVGIVNTMLMSVNERVTEFGVLRATGWRRRDVIRLVLLESAGLGLAGGTIGCAIGSAVVVVVGFFLPLRPAVTPSLLATSFGIAIGLGVLGGLYPAWRASRLNPIDAIRFG